MTADRALRGWIAPGTMGQNPGEVVRVWSSGDLYDDMEEVAVVGREEWERIHGAAWIVCAGVLQDQQYPYDPEFTADVNALAEIVKDTGPRAILGTNGGGK